MNSPTGARILAIDGDRGMLHAMRASLAGRGFRVEIAASGGQGLELFRSHHPDVREYVKRLRKKLGEGPGNPHLIVSASGGYRLETDRDRGVPIAASITP